MINKLIRISKEKEYLEKEFLESLFLKRINKILSNLELYDLKLKMFHIDRREIRLSYRYYIGCNEYDNISITLPIKFYFNKYNIILKYIIDNINDNDLFWNIEEYKDVLSNSFISFSKENKLLIKNLNRQLNTLYILDNKLNVIPVYNKLEFNKIKGELSYLELLKEF